jgi:acetyl-CoA carboxylase biotin carboxylase subunit
VTWQIRIARGEALDLPPEAALTPRGHALECRIYAEDPDGGFAPSPGRITGLRVPDGPGIRHDGGVEVGADVPVFYDPLLSKLIAWGRDRTEAIVRMQRALDEYDVRGIETTVPFFRWMLAQREFLDAAFHTRHLDEVLHTRTRASFTEHTPAEEEAAAIVAALLPRVSEQVGLTPVPGRRSTGEAPPSSVDGWARTARLEALRT